MPPNAAGGDGAASGGAGAGAADPTAAASDAQPHPSDAQQQGNGGNGGIPVQSVAMKLLDVRLKPATAIVTSAIGSFTAPGQHEIAVLRCGGTLELHRIVQVDGGSSSSSASSNKKDKDDDEEDDDDDDDDEEPRTVLKLLTRVETRSVLRSCAKIRYPGETRDVLAVTADSGALSVLDFSTTSTAATNSAATGGNRPKIVHCVVFGKTACRRDTPGQYCAADPAGRAVLVAAVEKRKLVYVLNRDAAGQPVIASPLEAHRPRSIVYAVAGLDNGRGNPVFAALELQYPDYAEIDPDDIPHLPPPVKQLAYYELDLGLNHVSRRWAAAAHRTAACLAALPGGADGPGGVLVGSEDYIEYLHETLSKTNKGGSSSSSGERSLQGRVVCCIPRRKLHPAHKGILVTHITVHRQKKSKFFCLAQTELGDVYKVTLETDPADKTRVTGLRVALLDTLPTANALNISDLGLLFCAAEFGDHQLYQFLGIDLPDAPSSHSRDLERAFAKQTEIADAESYLVPGTASNVAPAFHPTVLRNLRRVCTADNPAPTTGVLVGELAGGEVSPQIYALTGRGPHSALRVLRHGASVTELAASELPGVPGGIFTVADGGSSGAAAAASPSNDKYIVVSFADATLVLSVGESVEEVGDRESGFLTNAPTLACSALAGTDGALVQVHPAGVRQIQNNGQALQWHCPGLKRIECASANESQVLVAFAGGEVRYFEVDPMSGNLTEMKVRDMGADVCSLDVGTITRGRSRSLFAAVGCRDQTVRIVSLEPASLLTQKSSTALKSRPHSLALQMMTSSSSSSDETGAARGVDDLTLMIGLDDGSSLRASIDPVTGSIGTSPTRRFLGARPVSISKITLEGQPAALMLSSRPWISRRDNTSGKHVMAPLSFAPLDHGCSFRSDAVREGVIATAGKTLRILSVDAAGMSGGDDEAFNTNKVGLTYTPRQMTLISTASAAGKGGDARKVALVVVESDYNEYGLEEKKAMGFDATGEGIVAKKVKAEDDAMDMDEGSDEEGDKNKEDEKKDDGSDDEDPEEKEASRTPIRGPVPPGPGHWGSCVRLLDPSNNCDMLDCVEMGRNEAALCCASVRFHSKGGEPLLAVGTVTGMKMHPLKQSSSHIVLYRIVNGNRFQLLHRTQVDDGPVLSLAHFQGRLVVGVGKSLRLYEMGKRQLLRKCELRGLPTFVKTIQTVGDRAFVGDMMQSVQIVRYDASYNKLVLIANDASPRPIVCQELLDWNTVAVGDKFGNVSILRLPRGADGGAIDLTGQRALWDSSRDDTMPKMELLCQYCIGEIVTSMTRSSLVAGGLESLIYVTVSGRIGALVPITSRDQVEFYCELESALRTDAPRPTGRDPRSYRSYYAPVMHVVDGDLCDAFNSLTHEEQTTIAERLELSVGEVMKKLEDTRNALL